MTSTCAMNAHRLAASALLGRALKAADADADTRTGVTRVAVRFAEQSAGPASSERRHSRRLGDAGHLRDAAASDDGRCVIHECYESSSEGRPE